MATSARVAAATRGHAFIVNVLMALLALLTPL
jgi:hypothetical protein